MKTSGNSIVMIISIVIVLVLIVYATIRCTKERYAFVNVDGGASYYTLGTMGAQPVFDSDVIRRCQDGWYGYTDDPSMNAVCSPIPPSVMYGGGRRCGAGFDAVYGPRSCACGAPGIYGRPVHMSYTVPGNISCPGCDMNNALNLS